MGKILPAPGFDPRTFQPTPSCSWLVLSADQKPKKPWQYFPEIEVEDELKKLFDSNGTEVLKTELG